LKRSQFDRLKKKKKDVRKLATKIANATETITSTRQAGCPSSSEDATSADMGQTLAQTICSLFKCLVMLLYLIDEFQFD